MRKYFSANGVSPWLRAFCVTCVTLAVPCVVAAQPAQPVSSHEPASAEPLTVFTASEPHRELKENKILRAYRLRGQAPTIDGRLTDEAWNAADQAIDFVQRDPDNGAPVTERTFVQVAFDDTHLYVAFTCLDRDPRSIARGLARRDEVPQTDYVVFAVDPRHDHQTGYAFQTNPSGWQGDFSYSDDERTDRDYNAVWEVRTQVTERGWTAEFRVPFSQMRFNTAPGQGQVWGFNALRQIRRRSESATWVAKPRGERGDISLFGHLVFEEPLPSPRRLELVPYVLGRSTHRPDADLAGGAAAGLDMRVGVGTAATLSATVNPDFGQVEQDPAVLNLSVFETFFPEKRPFFLEDSRTFVPPYGLFQLFHSRRIGRAPGRIAINGDDVLVREPDETTILGAAKLTGKKSAWTYGALTALTGSEHATVDAPFGEAGALSRQERLIEPRTSYNVIRVQKDVRGGTSNVGGIMTGVFRNSTEDAFTGGFDYNLRWDQNRTGFNGHWVATRAPGTGGVRTSGGGVSNLNVTHKHWELNLHGDHLGKDFRVNDIGFLRTRANRTLVEGGLSGGQPDPQKHYRRVWFGVWFGQGWNDERLVFTRYAEVNASIGFRNYWNASGGTGRNLDAFDDLDTRGGPPIEKPGYQYFFFNVNTDTRKSWRINFGGDASKSDVGGHSLATFVGVNTQPSDRVQASVTARYQSGLEIAQWFANEDLSGTGVLDNLYGRLRRDVVDLTLRGTYAFTRDLTLQGYLQPFVAVGDYYDLRRLARARSFEFDPITTEMDPDFNTKSLRGNIVLRWEYNRGSTLFVVWDLSQADATRPGTFSPLRDLGSAFGGNATHALMIKASYWLNR